MSPSARCWTTTTQGPKLLRTLRAYSGCGGGLIRAGEQLHLHVDTVAQCLERIGSLLRDDWRRPHGALGLQLALWPR